MSKSPVTRISEQPLVAGLALVLILYAPCALSANANHGAFLTAESTTGATASVDAGAGYVGVHVWRADAAAASTSVVYLQVSADNVAWYRAWTFTNVTGLDGSAGDGGEATSVPSWPFMRLYVANCGVGVLSAKWFKR